MNINTFLDNLQSYQQAGVFNPWREYAPAYDIGPQAPDIRSANLRRYLELRQQAHYLFIAEALGYQGGHFSGIAITSERILLGHHPDVDPQSVLGGLASFDVILWNIFPFHPYKGENLLTNRTPSTTELDVGIEYARMLLELVPNMQIIAIGQKAAGTLTRYGVSCTAVPHPSMGGANRFKAAVDELLGGGV